jgi:hypothetical protein
MGIVGERSLGTRTDEVDRKWQAGGQNGAF